MLKDGNTMAQYALRSSLPFRFEPSIQFLRLTLLHDIGTSLTGQRRQFGMQQSPYLYSKEKPGTVPGLP